MSIDQSITQIAMMMAMSEAEVRAAFDKLMNSSQPYVPIQGFCKNAKCPEYDAVIRKRIRNRMRRFYKSESEVENGKCK